MWRIWAHAQFWFVVFLLCLVGIAIVVHCKLAPAPTVGDEIAAVFALNTPVLLLCGVGFVWSCWGFDE